MITILEMDLDRVTVYFINDKLKPRFAWFQLKCPMPIALRVPSPEYISRFALRLGFVGIVDWNMWKSIARSSWPLLSVRRSQHRPWQVVYRLKTGIKWWSSSQWWPLSTKNPAQV